MTLQDLKDEIEVQRKKDQRKAERSVSVRAERRRKPFNAIQEAINVIELADNPYLPKAAQIEALRGLR